MTRRRLSLSMFFGLAMAALTGCELDLERMIRQHRYDPYEPSPYLESGTIMQHPPSGTVPWSRPGQAQRKEGAAGNMGAAGSFEELASGMRDGTFVQALAVAVSPELLQRGHDRFRIFCAPCHGIVGDGNTPIAADMQLRPPPSLHLPRIRAYPAGRLFRVITDGYGLMRPYAAELSVNDRWAVVAYVQALQLSQQARLEDLPAEVRTEARSWLNR